MSFYFYRKKDQGYVALYIKNYSMTWNMKKYARESKNYELYSFGWMTKDCWLHKFIECVSLGPVKPSYRNNIKLIHDDDYIEFLKQLVVVAQNEGAKKWRFWRRMYNIYLGDTKTVRDEIKTKAIAYTL